MDCQTIQLDTTCVPWIHLPRNAKSGVGSAPSRHPCQQIAPQMFITPHGYYKCANTPGLWKHTTSPILFTLVVDNFGVKYVGKQHVNHLIWFIKQKYELAKDWTGNLYCKIKLNWDYNARTLDISMPGYIKSCYCNISIASHQSRSIAHMLLPPKNTEPKHKRCSPSISCQNFPQTRSRKSNASL